MVGIDRWQKVVKRIIVSLLVVVLSLSLASCGDRAVTQTVPRGTSPAKPAGNVSEVSPPPVIQELRQILEIHQPQVAILSPQPDEVLQDNTVKVKLQVQDLPIFKDQELDLGPHLHVILDNQPYIAVYDVKEPLVLPDLPPGTHSLRVFASRPWHESFKNEGAYAQTTFHVFTKTQDNNPDPAQPLLTYSRPKGSYGAEPILLDFYLTNAPLHIVAQEDPKDDVADWRVRCTVNGNSFVVDRWEPLYLKGFKPGKNWVQMEFIDEKGNPVKNVFNNTARLITYEPQGKDTLSKLVRGEISASEARKIVDPNYTAEEVPAPAPTLAPTPTISPSPTPAPSETLPPTSEAKEKVEETPALQEEPQSKIEAKPDETKHDLKQSEEPKPRGGFFNRFRRPAVKPAPTPSTAPEAVAPPALLTPLPESTVEPSPTPQQTTPTAEPSELEVKPEQPAQTGGFFNRRQRPSAPSPSLPPTPPEILEPPSEPSNAPQQESKTEPSLVTPSVAPFAPTQPEPKLPLPEIIEAPAPEVKVPEAIPQPEIPVIPSPKSSVEPLQQIAPEKLSGLEQPKPDGEQKDILKASEQPKTLKEFLSSPKPVTPEPKLDVKEPLQPS